MSHQVRRSYERGEVATGEPKHFVLVHGAWHGAWCWATTARLLMARGHRVTPLDLLPRRRRDRAGLGDPRPLRRPRDLGPR
ncbi:hypothetical protein [Nannocystis pusilla]|uniref:hypothetical protein n=1 Tax=Nannocystis pusilla TaxID=889268 RepID=UPI003B7EA90F